MPADICPAKPLAKGPFPLESPCLASVTAGTRPRPWAGLCWVLGDAVPCPTAPALPLGQVAVACQVTCSRATLKYFITIFYRNILSQYFIAIFYYNILLHYFITIFYHNIFEALYAVTSHVPDVLVWRQTQPWLCCGVLSLVSDLSEVYATPRVRLLCSPRSSPRNILNPQTGAALKKGRRLKSHLAPGIFTKKKAAK